MKRKYFIIPVLCLAFFAFAAYGARKPRNAFPMVNSEEMGSGVDRNMDTKKMNKGFDTIGYMGTYGLEVNGKLHRDERFLYFRQIMKSLEKYDEKYIYLAQSNHTQFGYRLGKEIIRKGRLPRAVFVENDTMAIGFLKALEEEKIAVPGDVAIIGCNDDQAASFVTPALSTVKLHNDLIGMMAAKTLMECLWTDRERGLKIVVPNQLILRESCPE